MFYEKKIAKIVRLVKRKRVKKSNMKKSSFIEEAPKKECIEFNWDEPNQSWRPVYKYGC